MNFRADINGLRAIAVIAVVLFHFKPNWLPGGFAGVDVFFVISGYLMTGIIFNGLNNNRFDLLKFYLARANRIIPALFVLCVTVMVFGWFYINPVDYREIVNHALNSIGFVSNIYYWQESGYFDTASQEKWLLHTWSLSVEWQFYLLYPIILLALKRFFSLKDLKKCILVGSVLSFLISIFVTAKWPSFAYYSLLTRSWEMMLGGVVLLYPWHISLQKQKLVESLGLVLILSSFAFVSSDTLWPGYFALMPVLGTYFIIAANRQNSIFTNNVVFQSLGKWSYSIYLWHWPIAVFGYYYTIENWYLYGIVLSIVFGFLSFCFIEKLSLVKLIALKAKPFSIAAIMLGLFAFVLIFKSNDFRYPLEQSIVDSMTRKPYTCFDKNLMHENAEVVCQLTQGEQRILAIGDSHSYSSLPAVEQIAKKNNISLFYTGFSGCPPLIGVTPIRADQNIKNCKVLNERAMQFAFENKIEKVFLAARWNFYTEGRYDKPAIQYLSITDEVKTREASIKTLSAGLKKTLKTYSENNINVILMLEVPMQAYKPDRIYYSSFIDGELNEQRLVENSIAFNKHTNFQKFTNELILSITKQFPNVRIVNPSESMCSKGYCPVGNKHVSFYVDQDHLSIMGANLLISSIEKALLN